MWPNIDPRNSKPISMRIALAAMSPFIKQVLQEYQVS